MFSPSTEYPESRPFKIFISLLDKWEIGGALTEAIVLDAFKALKSLVESDKASSEDVGAFYLLLLFLFKGSFLGRDDCEHTLRGCGTTYCVETVVDRDIE
jgi:hypothetical protein